MSFLQHATAVLLFAVFDLLSVDILSAATWTNTYDVMDRLASRTDPLGRAENFSYDRAGNLTRFTDRKGQATDFTYDPVNRLTSVSYADGSSTMITYDSLGRPMSLTDSIGGQIDLAYDLLNRVVRETTAQGSILYVYDALGRRTSMAVNGQAPVTYSYDPASRLTQVAQGNQVVTIAYDAAGRRTSLTYSNGTTTTYSYDTSSRLIGIFHAKGATTFESISYGYDAAGNRTAVVRGSSPATFLPASLQAAYDAANEQSRFNSSTSNMTYDANGNLISWTDTAGTTTYTWDARNRLVAVSGPNLVGTFIYDALNRRMSKTINGVTTRFVYDQNDVVQEISNGAIAASYLRNLTPDEAFVRIGATAEYYHGDALRTTLLLIDSAGAVQTTYSYSPFGETTVMGTGSANPFQLTGRENDNTGLYYHRLRYYSPEMHRFIQEDPIQFEGGDVNLYAYVGNNPIRYADPFGLEKSDKCPSFGNRYLDHVLTYSINVGPYAAAMGGGLWPKSWAPATGGRGPFLGSTNPLTSVPRALGVPGASTLPAQATAALIGGATVGIGFYNIGVFTSGLLYAIPSNCE